jgi:hypothetical protein
MNNRFFHGFKYNSVILRLRETLSFFRTYARDIGSFLLYATFPVIIIENFLSYYATMYNYPPQMYALSIMIHFLYQPIYTGGLILLISKIVSGEERSVKECLLVGLACWINLLFVNIISSLLIILGLIAFIIPGLIVFARLSLAEFNVVLERQSPIDALVRSSRVTKRFTWQIIGSVVLLSAMLLGIKLLINLVIATFSLKYLPVFIISELVVIILWSTLTILLFRFYDLASKASQQHDISLA